MSTEARWCALMVSSYHRTAKLPREELRAHVVRVLTGRGVAQAEAEREAEQVWVEFWERPSGAEGEK